jgi:hypothetical protein
MAVTQAQLARAAEIDPWLLTACNRSISGLRNAAGLLSRERV